jgi:DNA ligase-associated metallophosphoesterase
MVCEAEEAKAVVAGAVLAPQPEGALWWREERLLAVADLHLEKGSSFAARGMLLPPYDTATTLAALGRLIGRLQPRVVLALGDSFHESAAARRLSPPDRDSLARMQAGREWIWIAGNHDPDLPAELRGERLPSVSIGPLTFRHEPAAAAAAGEIAGHLHPSARVSGRLGSVRRRCFAGDGSRMVLPAFGAYAGGLNVLSRAFAGLFSGESFRAWMLNGGRIYPVRRASLRPD